MKVAFEFSAKKEGIFKNENSSESEQPLEREGKIIYLTPDDLKITFFKYSSKMFLRIWRFMFQEIVNNLIFLSASN